MIAIDLLSSFRLTCDRQPIVLQHRQVLLIQALWCAGGPLSADSLMRRLWEQPEPGSRATMRTHVSRTRKAVAAAGGQLRQLIITGQVGAGQTTYQLADDLDIDAERFRELAPVGSHAVRAGQYERGTEVLASALSLLVS
jgi:DNA-binding SARP family transcriptional activator